MGRNRTFDEAATLERAAGAFVARGYEGTSVDDLVRTLGLHRGSLYQAFGSKRGLFLATLTHHVRVVLATRAADPGDAADAGTPELDLLLVAAVERGPDDPEVAALVREGVATVPTDDAAGLLGARLLRRLHTGSTVRTSPDATATATAP